MINYKLTLAILLMGILVWCSCKTTQKLTPAELTKIQYGSYGGFAGAYTEYVLLKDGSVYSKFKINDDFSMNQSLSKENTDQIFKILDRLATEEAPIEDPGNMTYFIKYSSKDKPTIEWTWGGTNTKPTTTLKILYRNLTTLSKKTEVVM